MPFKDSMPAKCFLRNNRSALNNPEFAEGAILLQLLKDGKIRADQNTGGALLKFPVRTAMHGKSQFSSAVKYDFLKLDDSGNCIIRKRHGCIMFDLKRNLG